MKKYIFSCVLAICFSQALFAQRTLLVVDGETGKPVSEALATWAGGQTASKSDGTISIPDTVKQVTFSRTGYLPQSINLKTFSSTNIILVPNGQLAEVRISAYPYVSESLTAPASYTKVVQDEIRIANQVDYGNVLNNVPGVFMHTGTLGTNRITIRGIGARTPFGTNKIRAYYGEIPLTAGDGETSLEDNDLTAIGTIEIIKGPAATAYGAGLAGLIKLRPTNIRERQITSSQADKKTGTHEINTSWGNIESIYGIGSFGLSRTRQSLQLANEKHAFQAVYSTFFQDGYRKNNQYNRENLLINYQYKDEAIRVDFLSTFTDVKGFIPSSLSENDFRENPSSAAVNWAGIRGFEDYTKGLIGSTLTLAVNAQQTLSGTVFTTFRENYELRPFGILTEQSQLYGFRWKYTNELSNRIALVAGGEQSIEDYQTITLQQENRLPVAVTSYNDQKRRNFNVFTEATWLPASRWTVTGGINLSRLSYDLRDLFLSNGDQSGNYAFDPVVSPRFMVGYRPAPTQFIYSQISHGFSAPSVEETLTPDGQINTDIQPEKGISIEMGTRGSILTEQLTYAVNVYSMSVRDLLVARRTTEDQFVGVNAGKTSHRGLEASINYTILREKIRWSPFLNFTINAIRFEDFIDGESDYSGNKIPGVPTHQLQAGISLTLENGFTLVANLRSVGEMYLRDDNILSSEAYTLINWQLAYGKSISKFHFTANIGINNVLEEQYAAQLLINAGSFGGIAPRYFYPGNPRNFYGNLGIGYRL